MRNVSDSFAVKKKGASLTNIEERLLKLESTIDERQSLTLH